MPLLYRFVFDTPFTHGLAYVLAGVLVIYTAWSGWRGAHGGPDLKRPGEFLPATEEQKRSRAISYGGFGLLLAWVGLYYALPDTVPFLGRGKGDGIPIHTYGVLVGGGFIAAVTVASLLAFREWPGEEGARKRDEILDLAFYVFVGAMIGSRELFVLVNWKSDYGGTGAKAAEGYATILDLVVLAGLILAVVFRDKLFSDPGLRKRLRENAFWIFVGTVVAGRVFFVFMSGKGGIGDVLGGGLVFYGGLIGASITAFWYASTHNIEFMRLADIAMPTVSLGQALGRLGCFSAGCCWGDVTTEAYKWGVHFPGAAAKNILGGPAGTSSLAYQSQSTDTRWVVESTGQVLHDAAPGAVRISEWVSVHGHTLPVHPTQLYESVGQLILFLSLLTLRRFRRFHGMVFGTWLICYAILRSTVELFRGDVERGTLHGLLNYFGLTSLADKVPLEAWYNMSISQFISLCMFTLGATVLVRGAQAFKAQPQVDLNALAIS